MDEGPHQADWKLTATGRATTPRANMHITDLPGGGRYTAGEWPVLVIFVLAVIYITVFSLRRGRKEKRGRQKERQERGFE